ncbi:DEAD/DEAH box helicase [Pseudoalteromonas sp. GB56]
MTTLPINAIENEFLQTISNHNVIVHAPTGSGKSTCLPVWAARSGRVLVVQPRRIAATSLAHYLAQKSGQKLGQEIGYAIRFEAQFSEDTRIVFATPGVVLRWFFESQLKDYDVVMLDEFHERRWDTDLLLALLKHYGRHRLVVTSATLESDSIANYIDATTLHSDGRMFAIRSTFLSDEPQAMPSRYDLAPRVYEACNYALEHSHNDILVFLPGRAEINECMSLCRTLPVQCIGLHGSSPMHEQQQALHQCDERRIIFATNVAQTSLTVPGIECVIDSGLERRTHLRKGKTVLGLDAIAKDSQQQRKGRCGRTAPGLYIGLFGENAPLLARTPVEVEREALDELVLASACANIKVDELNLLTPLPPSSLEKALTHLNAIGAIDDKHIATELGRRIYPLPVDANLGYLIEAMPTSTLRQAMIDIASVIATPAQLYASPTKDNLLQLANALGEQVISSDIALSIAAVRGQGHEFLAIDTVALDEAGTYSNYLRIHYQLPEIAKSARFDYTALISAIAKSQPECIFVRRNNRRGGLGNGAGEIRPAKNSLLPESTQAALVLDSFSLAGKGKKHADTLATLCAPISLNTVLHCVATENELVGCYLAASEQSHSPQIWAQLCKSYAGVVLETIDCLAPAELLIDCVVKLIIENQLFIGVGEQLAHDIAYHQLYLRYHAIEKDVPSIEQHLHERLHELGVQDQDDLALLEASDLSYKGIDEWEAKEFIERYPLQVTLPGVTLNIEYLFKAKRVVAHYASGERKDPPKRWELPTWSGLQIRFKKASKVVDIR